MAATFVAAFALGAGVMAWRSGELGANAQAESLTHDLFASHLRALAAASPIDVVSSDRHTVKPWFAGKVGQSPTVRDFAPDGFPLLGGRIDYVGERRVPVLVYGHGRHVIDVFVLPEDAGSIGSSITQRQGYRLASVRVDGQPMWIVTDLDEHEFARFVRLLGTMPNPETPERAP
jgi:anti-sigma factor RsiW